MLEQVEGVMTGERLQAILTAGDAPGERGSLAQELAITTVLVVHRDRGNVAWLNDYLEKAGFRVVVAQDGLTGLEPGPQRVTGTDPAQPPAAGSARTLE